MTPKKRVFAFNTGGGGELLGSWQAELRLRVIRVSPLFLGYFVVLSKSRRLPRFDSFV